MLYPEAKTATIASGQTTSGAVCIGRRILAAIQTPAALTGSALAIHASTTESGTYAPVYDSDGVAVSVAAAASRFIGLSQGEADATYGALWVKLVSNASEGADRSFTLSLR